MTEQKPLNKPAALAALAGITSIFIWTNPLAAGSLAAIALLGAGKILKEPDPSSENLNDQDTQS